jgi:hypothetical protein
VHDFLQAWYVDQNLDSLGGFIATDNSENYLADRGMLPNDVFLSYWASLFYSAFEERPGLVRFESLKDAISYEEPDFPTESRLSYRNDPGSNFAIVVPELAALSLFPPEKVPQEKLDPPSQLLWHLRNQYFKSNEKENRLYLVVYSTTGTGLLQETSVLYWIREQAGRKLAAFQGTE